MPIDAIGIDKDGDIYIIETKLFKNPDKRTVIAQVLDYGASLWKYYRDFDEFMSKLNEKVQSNFNLTFEEKAKEMFELEDEEEFHILRSSMKTNLQSGDIKFVILMDSLEERLKDLILYINHHSKFDIYAVQIEYYKFDKYEIVIPKLFGGEDVKPKLSKTPPFKDWEEAFAGVTNPAVVEFFRREIASGQENNLKRRRLRYHFDDRKRYSVRIVGETSVRVHQYGRFKDDEGFWRKKFGPNVAVKVLGKNFKDLLFLLTSDEHFYQFKEALQNELKNIKFMGAEEAGDVQDGDE